MSRAFRLSFVLAAQAATCLGQQPQAGPSRAIIAAPQVESFNTPGAIRGSDGVVAAPLPEELSLGFALEAESDGRRVSGDWNVKGRVVEIGGDDNPSITIEANDQRYRLLYRLPEGLSLPLTDGQEVTIRRDFRILGASFAYDLKLFSEDEVILVAERSLSPRPPGAGDPRGRVLGDLPDEAGALRDLAIACVSEAEWSRDSKYAKISLIPVQVSGPLVDAGTSSLLSPRESVTLPAGEGVSHQLAIVQSHKVDPHPSQYGVNEGKGYLLEYVLVKAPE